MSVCFLFALTLTSPAHAVEGWLNWRGPNQNGTSAETNLMDEAQPNGENHLWSYDIRGRGTPVIAGERVYVFGYEGEGPDMREYLVCLDSETGEEIWKQGFNDFLSDIVYDRYSIGSPVVDEETGNVYLQTTPGDFYCFTADGEQLWYHSMMEEYGRLSFPNGRTGAPVIEDDLVIIHGITTNWGGDGPARDRFYAFDKKSGALVWTSTPGVGPQDSSFSTPIFGWEGEKRVFYAGTGCGNLVCVNARNGKPVWRFQMSHGGVNISPVLWKDRVIAIHGKENLDSSVIGRMAAIQTGPAPESGVLGQDFELWRNDLTMFTSSPTLAGDRVYQVVHTGELHCVSAETGELLWDVKLANTQLHASPLYADGKLYVPMRNGTFYIIKIHEDRGEILNEVQLEGNCLGSPSLWDGQMYVHTTEKLYCFNSENAKAGSYPEAADPSIPTGEPDELQIVPSEVLLNPGETQTFKVEALDQNGKFVKSVENAQWESFIPPNAKVKVRMEAEFNEEGKLVVPDDAQISAGAFQASADGVTGTFRGRVLPALPYEQDFEDFELTVPHATVEGVKFAFPPLPWIGARFKWEIWEREGNKVLAKTLDNVLFQRATTFIGETDMSNYTISADVLTDGGRRMMSNAGVVNQRYIIALIGNWQQLEVSSNYNRIKVGVPFTIKPNTWYRIKSRVDAADDGSGVVRAKAWERSQEEPEEWMIEVPHKHAHTHGSPGVWGFSPQSRYRVYMDNIVVEPND